MTETMQSGQVAPQFTALDQDVQALQSGAEAWARSSIDSRLAILAQIKDRLMNVAPQWAAEAARQKQIPADSPLVGEEWISGPYAVMGACNQLMHTLSKMKGKAFLDDIPLRETTSGQVSAKILPHSIWDHLLLSGVSAEVWMEKGVTRENLKQHTASAYDLPDAKRKGLVALVLGAGNIAAIAPLDCFQKLFSENQVVILKMNPVNDYLTKFLLDALKPLVDANALRIVKGGADVGQYLCNHASVDEIHITGAGQSHDAIVWGIGEEGARNKAAKTPKNKRRITSELGAVCPTIVVPGPWSNADITFQAGHIATQKLHNSGFNCVACQVLILPEDWSKTEQLMAEVERVIRGMPTRGLYYPGAANRMQEFSEHSDSITKFERDAVDACFVAPISGRADVWFENNEVFAPAMSTYKINQSDPEAYLRAAVSYANKRLHGTLGANILIHPATLRQIGKQRFEEIIADLHYGTIAINAWTGLGFLMAQCTWGAFPGHKLDDVQSGIGVVHNTFMFDKPERCIVRAPFRPFPRNLLSLNFTLLPKPPWFVTNRKQHKIGMLLTRFQYKPSFLRIPRIFLNALLG
jgi:acyl-CoA reductase-like NAD-dependent aldehyde dehydrogenase